MDIDRAFRKMSEIKPHIKVWWREGSQSQQLIRDGEVDMIAMWSARAVDLIDDKVPLELVWNGAEIYYANLLVPKGDPNAKAAWQFCNFVAQAKPQANFAMLLPYGPANPDARALMSAREGRFPDAIAADVAEEYLRRYFIRDGDIFRLSGSKTFISGIEHADAVLVVARSRLPDGQLGLPSLCLVDVDAPGFTREWSIGAFPPDPDHVIVIEVVVRTRGSATRMIALRSRNVP